jgi:ABC-type transport system substrate-binding protein
MTDPVVGGYTNEKIALRRAISMGYDRDADIKLIANGQGIPATQLAPPGVYGYDPAISAKNAYDPAAARALLDKFGYQAVDTEGYRKTPDGKPLTLVKASATAGVDRTRDELWKRNMDAIGLRMTFLKQKWPELNRMSEAGQLMMWNLGWISSVPDGDTFYSVLYSKNIGTSNDARFRLPEYDRLYEQSRRLPEGRERTALYRKMNELVQTYAPWVLGDYPYGNVLAQPWLKGYKYNPYLRNQWKYYDVERP